jgi:hypothetical protein
MRHLRRAALACALASAALATAAVHARVAPIDLAGAWEMNRDLSSAPGSGPGGPAGPERRGPGSGRGQGGGRRGPGGGGFGGRAGVGGGRPRGGPPGGAPTREDMEARRALMQEVLTLPARLTITQDGDKVVFIEPDGVVRTYAVNGATEKHQLTNGTIETKARWDGQALRMELVMGARVTLVRTFRVTDDPRRLQVSTVVEGGPKDQAQLTVYDEAPPQH